MSMDNSLRYLAIFLNIGCVLIWVWLVRIHQPLWPTVMIPIVLFLHTIIFYAVAIDRHAAPSVDLTMWSNGLRIHEALTWLIGGYIMGHVLSNIKRAGEK